MTDLFDLAVIGPFSEPPPEATRPTVAPSQDQQIRYLRTLERLRWGDRLRCPHCQSGRVQRRSYAPGQGNLRCRDCRRHFNARTGTVLNHSKLDFPRWFALVSLTLNPVGTTRLGPHRAARLLGMNHSTTEDAMRRIRSATGDEAAFYRAIANVCQVSVHISMTSPQSPLLALPAALAA